MRKKQIGFTLTELMIVVVIIAILAAIAIPIYSRYIRKARTSEAVSNLGTIAMFEETYFSEADSYVSCDANPSVVPDGGLPTGRLPFNQSINGWSQLGRVIPDGTMLYFQYEVRAGQYGTGSPPAWVPGMYLKNPAELVQPGAGHCSAASVPQLNATNLNIPNTQSSNWYYATAVGDQKFDAGSSGTAKCSLFIKVIDRPDISITNDIE